MEASDGDFTAIKDTFKHSWAFSNSKDRFRECLKNSKEKINPDTISVRDLWREYQKIQWTNKTDWQGDQGTDWKKWQFQDEDRFSNVSSWNWFAFGDKFTCFNRWFSQST